MARTLNREVHAVRRDAFVDAAQRLVQTRGYEQMSIQDLLDDLDASRGAFYHYFDGKAALLDAVIERMVDQAWVMLEGIVADPSKTAPEKMRAMFGGLASFKAERRELVLGIVTVWLSDDNAIVREKFRRGTVARLAPLLAAIIRQGIDEGSVDVTDPEAVATVLASLVMGANESATQLFVERQAGNVELPEVERRLAAFGDGFERILGLPPGSTPLADRDLIQHWYA